MKREKKYRISSLVSLYISYIFQKTTLIIFLVSLILITTFLVLISNPHMQHDTYLMSYESIHNAYLTQGLFVIQIFNSVIIATIIISLIINCISFDSLFISYTPRSVICLSKLLAIVIVISILSIFEIVILHLIPLIFYSKYTIEVEDLLGVLYLLVSNLVESIFSVLLTTLVSSVLSSMILMFIFVVVRLLCNNFDEINKIITPLLPVLEVDKNNLICDAIIISPLWLILLSLLYVSCYSIKDLKQM